MKGNNNYKQKLDAVLELLKNEKDENLYEAAVDLCKKNFLELDELKYILSSNENTAILDQNDISYTVILSGGKPHILIGVTGVLVQIPCTAFSEDSYELNPDAMIEFNHEDVRSLVEQTEDYRNEIHKIAGDYELEMVVSEHGGMFSDFD